MGIIKLDKRYIAHNDYGMTYCIEFRRSDKTIYRLRAIAWDVLMPTITMNRECRQSARHMLRYSWYIEYGVDWDRAYFRTKEDADKVVFMYGLKH